MKKTLFFLTIFLAAVSVRGQEDSCINLHVSYPKMG